MVNIFILKTILLIDVLVGSLKINLFCGLPGILWFATGNFKTKKNIYCVGDYFFFKYIDPVK